MQTQQKNKPTAAPAEIILYRAVSLARRLMDENPDMQPDKATSIASMSGHLDGYCIPLKFAFDVVRYSFRVAFSTVFNDVSARIPLQC